MNTSRGTRRARSSSPIRQKVGRLLRSCSVPASARSFRNDFNSRFVARSPTVHAGTKRKREDDDERLFDPAVDAIMDEDLFDEEGDNYLLHPDNDAFMIGGGAVTPLFDFVQRSTLPPRQWKSAASQFRHQLKLKTLRENTANDNVGKELTDALRRSINTTLGNTADLGDEVEDPPY